MSGYSSAEPYAAPTKAVSDTATQPSPSDVDRLHQLERAECLERARNGLLNFIFHTHPLYEANWHHIVICRVLNAFARGDLTRLIITCPPRHGKTQICSRALPAYMLGRNPDLEIMAASYGATLAKQINRDVQRIMTSPAYAEVFPHTQLNARNVRMQTNGGSWMRNSDLFEVVGRRGRYQSAGIGGALTGSGADRAIIDDPYKGWQDASSPLYRERAWDWYANVLYTRLSKGAGICIVTTRWHEDDLAGRLIARMEADAEADQWTVLNLEAIKETPKSSWDKRELGDALWPSRFPAERLEQVRKLSTRTFEALYQGRPSPAEGNIVQDSWWRFARRAEVPSDLHWWRISCDLTFKDKEKDDFSVFQVWGGKGANRYLIDQLREKAGFLRQCNMLLQLLNRWPGVTGIFIEDTANGPALINALRDRIAGLIPVQPIGSKVARAEAVTPTIESGNVFIPHPDECAWVMAYVQEWHDFPQGKNDDQVDATSQLLLRMREELPDDLVIPLHQKPSRWRDKLRLGGH